MGSPQPGASGAQRRKSVPNINGKQADPAGSPPGSQPARAPQRSPATSSNRAVTLRAAQKPAATIIAGIKSEIAALRAILRKSRLDGAREGADRVHALFGDLVASLDAAKISKTAPAATVVPADWQKEVAALRAESRASGEKMMAAIEAIRCGQAAANAQPPKNRASVTPREGGKGKNPPRSTAAVPREGENGDIPPCPSAETPREGGKGESPPHSWALVARRKKASPVASSGRPPVPPTQPAVKKPRSRPSAILVDGASLEEFPALVQRIRKGVDKGAIGSKVVGMRQARSGGLLIEVRGDAAQVDAIRAEVARSAGSGVAVNALVRKATLEIRDLDQWTSREEVLDAVAAASGVAPDSLKVLSLRARFGATQVAVVSVPATVVAKLVSDGRLIVGLVSCRLRVLEDRQRCFRCLSFGHTAASCSGPDRSSCCWSCGSGEHKAADCDGTPAVRTAFAGRLAGKGEESKA